MQQKPIETVEKMLHHLGANINRSIIDKMIKAGSFSTLNKKDQAYGEYAHVINKIVLKLFNPISKKLASKLSMIILSLVAKTRSLFGKTKSQKNDSENNSHYRKGISGDWKNHLSEKEAAYIDAELKELHQQVLLKPSKQKVNNKKVG